MARAAASPAEPMRKVICVLRISSPFRFAPCIILALLSLGAVAAQAARIDDLYRAQVVVSGRGEANRATGFAQCLEDVLVKVSGDPRLIGDARVAAIAGTAGSMVAAFTYRDRLSGVPIHDEQGSYDRPNALTVDFDPISIDAALEHLGREPWLSQRPRVVVVLRVTPRTGPPFMLSSDSSGPNNADMRFSLAAAAARVAMPMELPLQANAGKSDPKAASGSVAAGKGGDEVELSGTLAWSDAAKGWVADWRIKTEGRDYLWQVRGVGFDDAVRNGMRGAAQVLSGNGQPT